MILAPLPPNETERLASLRTLKILDTPGEERFDRITRLASQVFNVPMVSISFVDADRLWLKSQVGIPVCEMDRKTSLCAHTILQGEPLVVEDTSKDARFADNPLVVSGPKIRFYAGCALSGPNGHRIGTFCLSDSKSRAFSPEDRASFKEMARLIEREIEMVDLIKLQSEFLTIKERWIGNQAILNQELREAAAYVRSLLPAPLDEARVKTHWRYLPSSELGGDAFGYYWLDESRFAFYVLDVSGHGVGSALLSVSILNALRSQTLPQTNFSQPPRVLQALNRAYPMEAQGGKCFSIWYGVYDALTRELEYSSAGHPPAILIHGPSASDNRMKELSKGGVAIGLLPDAGFESEIVQVPPFNKIFLFSDGIYEWSSRDGASMNTFQDWLDYVAKASLSENFNIDTALGDLSRERKTDVFNDDVSILQISFKTPA